MGWRWHDDDGDGGRGRGLGDIADLAGRGGGGGEGAHCATRRVVRSRCHTEEVEPSRFVRKYEKTEQLLRGCVGRYSPRLALFLDSSNFSCKNRPFVLVMMLSYHVWSQLAILAGDFDLKF